MTENHRKTITKKLYAAVVAVAFVVAIASFVLAVNNSPISQQSADASNSDATDVNANTSTTTAQASLPELTGKLSLYILPLEYGQRYKSAEMIDEIRSALPGMLASQYSSFGASPQGVYSTEKVVLAEQDMTEDLIQGGFKLGDTVEMRVFEPNTVNVHIDPDIKKPDGNPVTIGDLRPDWLFGNGITCCGFTLEDGTDVSAVFFVVDQSYEPFVEQNIGSIKSITSSMIDTAQQ